MDLNPDAQGSAKDYEIQKLFDASKELYFATSEWLSKGNKLESEELAPVAIAFEVAMAAIKYGVPCPEWAAISVGIAWGKFTGFKCASISEAFEIPDHKQMVAKRDRLLSSTVYRRVRALQARGIPLKDGRIGEGALSKVGAEFDMSGKKVETLMKAWKDLCKITGSNPDAPLVGVGDAKRTVFEALARALSPY